MVIFDRKMLSNRDENGNFLIFSLDLPKTGIKVKSLCECFTVSTLRNKSLNIKYFGKVFQKVG